MKYYIRLRGEHEIPVMISLVIVRVGIFKLGVCVFPVSFFP